MTPTAVSAALLALAMSTLHMAARWHFFALDTSRMTSGAQHVAYALRIVGFGVESAKVFASSDELVRCHDRSAVM